MKHGHVTGLKRERPVTAKSLAKEAALKAAVDADTQAREDARVRCRTLANEGWSYTIRKGKEGKFVYPVDPTLYRGLRAAIDRATLRGDEPALKDFFHQLWALLRAGS